MKLIHGLKELLKDIRYFIDKEELDIDDIPPMRYPEGQEDRRENFVNPFTKYNSHHSRIRYNRKR